MIKSGSNEALSIVVRGYAVTVDATDATLSALSVSGATLSPAFAAATTTYSAPVENAVIQVTITETTSEPTATVEYLDGSDNTLTDADTMTAGLQVNLSVGTNPVKVKVTAPDTTTTETYTVNVFRVALPVECSAASRVNRIWTGNMIVGGSGDTRGFTSQRGYLDRTTFNFQGTTYTVNTLATELSGQFLSFGLDSFFPNAGDVVLHINDDQYPLDDATEQASAYIFSTNVPTWADGDATCLALTVDGPDVSSVELTSDPGTDNTYAISDTVTATVTFSAAVDITGTPQLELDFDGTPKPAACAAATNTTTTACEYEVVAGDSAPNGIAIGANKLTGGTIYATGGTTTSADLTHVAVAIDVGHKVDGIRPTLVTTGSEAPKTSTDGTTVILTFSEDIGGVSRSDITIQANSVTAATSAASVTGTTVELTLTTALTTTSTNLTVELVADAVKDDAGNGILAVAATAVTNAVGTTVSNTAPTFSSPTATRSVAENSAAGTNVGAALTATDTDSGDTLTYTLEGTDAVSFDIVSTSGQIQTTSGVTYDYETQSSYAVIVKADDGNGGSDTVAVTITVTDVNEPPARPAAPSVSSVAGSTTSLSVMWTAPANTGPAIDTYDLRYRQGTSGSWTNGPQNVSGLSATITGLGAGSYQVQVLATNADGDSPWSPPGSGQTNTAGNTAPTFSSPTATRSVAENSAAGTNVGAPVTATDADSGDTLTYTLDGTDAASFDIVSTSGQIQTTTGVTYDYETKSSYAVIVKADDGNGGSDTIMVTITVTDVDESPLPGPGPEPVPALPLLGHLLLALGLTGAGARLLSRRPRVPPMA